MCIIVDTNVFPEVFTSSCKNHKEFKPVFDWIYNKEGFLVFGGSKYYKELELAPHYLDIFNTLKDKGKVRVVNRKKVDKIELKVRKKIKAEKKGYDDPHLVAITEISKCKLVCTVDKGAMALLNDPVYFEKSANRPKIYSGSRNKNLLIKPNIVKNLIPN